MPDNTPTSPVALEQCRAIDIAGKHEVWLKISDISEAEFGPHIDTQMAARRLFLKWAKWRRIS